MSTMSLNVTVRTRAVLSWAAIIGGGAMAVIMGLLSAHSFFSNGTSSKAQPVAAQPVAAQLVEPEPVTFAIVPAAVIETNPQFFFGTGDGSNGYYSERPIK